MAEPQRLRVVHSADWRLAGLVFLVTAALGSQGCATPHHYVYQERVGQSFRCLDNCGKLPAGEHGVSLDRGGQVMRLRARGYSVPWCPECSGQNPWWEEWEARSD